MDRADVAMTMRLLSSMYLCQPSAEALRGWKSLLAEDVPEVLDDLKAALGTIDVGSDADVATLLWDYTRLFIGPYKLPCPPWESVYTSHKQLMMQEAAVAAGRAYAEYGLAVDQTAVMPDHIGAELNFLAVVYGASAEDAVAQAESARTGLAFLNDHLRKWVPQFTVDMEAAAETDLYAALARTTRRALELPGA